MKEHRFIFLVLALIILIPLNPSWAQEGQDIWNKPMKEPSLKPEAPPPEKKASKEEVKPPASVAEIIERVDPSVVFMEVHLIVVDPRDKKLKKTGFIGSGFFVSKNGYILTNAHVVSVKGYQINKRRIFAKTPDGGRHEAALIKQDAEMDLALLRITKKDCNPVKIGDPHTMRVGDKVIAIGNPSGLAHSATTGIISAFNREKGRIQTDVLTYHGSSGGPLFNIKGEVIGVIVSGLATMHRAGDDNIEVPVPGINFAIPINYANNLLQLVE